MGAVCRTAYRRPRTAASRRSSQKFHWPDLADSASSQSNFRKTSASGKCRPPCCRSPVAALRPRKNTRVFSGSADKYLIAHKIDTYGVISEKIVSKHSDHARWSREVPYMEVKRSEFVTVHFKVF